MQSSHSEDNCDHSVEELAFWQWSWPNRAQEHNPFPRNLSLLRRIGGYRYQEQIFPLSLFAILYG